ncbi:MULTISPECIES: alpha/beta fold hydrolase [unclassified Psychrobacter]|uniref:alpha/beta fold hydrolase n=1 Tax=unclassified Psychrobacter TaxID=196806 RepID=UPI0017888585|nr:MULTISPECIES: alpha/beta hydrolase [unclassified Psychrobacter]MBE0443250.1 alpha/beta hydrolase [Psychrobacter sp. FME13]
MSTQITKNHTYIDGHKIAFLEQGSGSPIILLHGIPTNSLMWRNIIPELAKTHRVIAPDLLNYGKSDKPNDADVSINAQSSIIAKLMDVLGARRADIVGHDIGGGIAQLIAVNYPEKIRKLVLIDSICFDSWPIPEFEPLQEPGAESDMSSEDFLTMMRGFLPKGVQDKSIMTDELIDMYLEPWSTEDGKHAFFRNLERLNKEYTQAIADDLSNLQQQTLIMWGDQDPFQKPDYAPKLVETIPNAELVWIKDVAHWLIDEKPDEIAEHLNQFLAKA